MSPFDPNPIPHPADELSNSSGSAKPRTSPRGRRFAMGFAACALGMGALAGCAPMPVGPSNTIPTTTQPGATITPILESPRVPLRSGLMPYCPKTPRVPMQKPMTFVNAVDYEKQIHAAFEDCTMTLIARVAPGERVTIMSPSNSVFMMGPEPVRYFCNLNASAANEYEVTMRDQSFSARVK